MFVDTITVSSTFNFELKYYFELEAIIFRPQ